MNKICSSGASDIGLLKKSNQDRFLCRDNMVFILADGVGGQKGGEKAAQIAIDFLDDYISPDLLSELINKNINQALSILEEGLKLTSRCIHVRAQALPSMENMSTTVIITIVSEDRVYICWLGDSRAYLLRKNGGLDLLTYDHSIAMEMARNKAMNLSEAMTSDLRYQLSRVAGGDFAQKAKPESTSVAPINTGDKLLLCSDGLNDMVNDEKIELLVKQKKPVSELCKDLINEANLNGGYDNITTIVIEIS